MSGLIKSGAGLSVRNFAIATAAVADDRKPSPDPRDARIRQLDAEIAELRDSLANAARTSKKAADTAYENGVAAGLVKAENSEIGRIKAIETGFDDAVHRFDAALATLEWLAPKLARSALGKMFGAVEDWGPMVDAILSRQLATLRRASVVSIWVSAEDFADPGTVTAIAAGKLCAAIDPDLPAGSARIQCTLGQIDLNAPAQWEAIAQLLDEMAA